MSVNSGWLKQRSTFTDWPADHKTREGKLVNLDWLSTSSGALAQHPHLYAMLRFCVGMQPLGGLLANLQETRFSGFSDDEPAPVEGQWLGNRENIAGWSADHRSGDEKLVSLENQNEGMAAHPLHFNMLRWCVGLARLGGILYPNPDSGMGSYFTPNDPVAVGGQWLVQRNLLSGWTGDIRTFEGRVGSLANQLEGFAAHPLPFALLRYCTGFIRLGGIDYPDTQSGTTIATAEDDLLLDALATEELSMLITEDTGEPIGLG